MWADSTVATCYYGGVKSDVCHPSSTVIQTMRRFCLAESRLIAAYLATGSLASANEHTALTHDVQVILDRNCVKCHGPLEQNAGLRLDSLAAIEKGGTDGPVIVLGQPESSKLAQVLVADADPHMPPKKQLADDDVAKV